MSSFICVLIIFIFKPSHNYYRLLNSEKISVSIRFYCQNLFDFEVGVCPTFGFAPSGSEYQSAPWGEELNSGMQGWTPSRSKELVPPGLLNFKLCPRDSFKDVTEGLTLFREVSIIRIIRLFGIYGKRLGGQGEEKESRCLSWHRV